jgi:hypothetical protein
MTGYMDWMQIAGGHYDNNNTSRISFRKITLLNSTDTISMMNFPGYNAGDFSFSQFDYVYPLDSIPGPVYGTGETIKISYINQDNRREIHFKEALPADIEVGMDIWVLGSNTMYANPTGTHEPSTMYGTAPFYNNVCMLTYQIESIDATRTQVVLDQPFCTANYVIYAQANALPGAPVADGSHFGWPNKIVYITTRRVPFQTRSVGVKAVFPTELHHPGVMRIRALATVACDPGDFVYPIITHEVVNERWPVLAVSTANFATNIDVPIEFATTPTGIQFLAKSGITAPHYQAQTELQQTGLFIHRVNTEKRRWAIDRKMLKLAATTFSYEFHQYNAHEIGTLEPSVQSGMVHNLQYPARLLQGHDDTMLRRQVVNTVKEIRRQSMSLTIASQESEITIGEVVEELPASIHNIPRGVIMPTARVFDMGITAVEDDPPYVSQRWGSLAQYGRLPQPYVQIVADGVGVNNEIWDFVEANPADKPWLVSVPQSSSLALYPTGQTYVNADPTTIHPVAITVVGTARVTIRKLLCGLAPYRSGWLWERTTSTANLAE